ncbi:MAG TPA: DNA primase [Acidimicrobiales bacterium]|nr:DNA primase [Acidimicrobiales bacterium]
MAIVEEDVARVRAATDFVAIATQHLALKRQGRRWVGLCPFHAEKTPSFSINAEEGLYYCFGCQASGDVITFVREVEHLGFVEAVERLAQSAGIQLRYDDGGTERRKLDPLYEAMEKAVDWYHERLLTHPDAAPARSYLRRVRGYDGEVVRRFRLGWAPSEWDGLWRGLRLPEAVMKEAGLGFVNRRGRHQDAFRSRLMFPIFDTSGRAVALGGRILPGGPEGEPKYKNSPDTPIYSKRRTLYGLNWSKSGIVGAGEVVVCEGYTDVIGFFTAGVDRAVATCGTALADEHFQLLKNFARRVVLAYDADTAGQSAAARFHEWERRFEVDIVVADLPAGQDPADVARRDPAVLRTAVEGAMPFLGFRVDRVLAAGDLRGPEGRARAAEQAVAVIAEHPNPLVRDQYLMTVADRCRVDPDRLRQLVTSGVPGSGSSQARSARGPTGAEPGGREEGARGQDGRTGAGSDRRGAAGRAPAGDGGRGASRAELAALRLAVIYPEKVADRLEEGLFTDPVHQAAFRAIASAESLHDAIAAAEPEAAALLTRLAVEDTDDDPDDVTARLAWLAAWRTVAELEASFRSTEVDDLAATASAISWLKLEMEALGDPATRVESTRRLVAWLAERGEAVP